MSYIIQSRILRGPRGIGYFLGAMGYLGLLAAPSVVFSVPFQVFHKYELRIGYWLTAAAVVWVTYRLGRFGYGSFSRRVVDLDSIVGFVGCLLAFGIAIWIYPPR